MREQATLKHLAPIEQIRYWQMVELWTIDEAALILAGIDPDDCSPSDGKSFESAGRFAHWEQYKYACIMRRALISAIAVGELSPFELWLQDLECINYNQYRAQPGHVPDCDEVIAEKTRIKPKTIGVWMRNKGHKTFRQIVGGRPITPAIEATPETIFKIEHRPYRPKHANPALETAIEINQEIYDAVEQGDKPPKAIATQETIKEKLAKKKGEPPTDNEVIRVDAIARPPCFKNQLSKKMVKP